ncbi:MAG: sulfatase-like hydrolase/transferase, partial [Bacteroidales bacterium]|nr:sulfatase-like hydrolase/transferase [Bacteroidales bacterium]
RFYQKYIDAGLDVGQARYASMVEGMDKSLGDILDYLEEKDIADNTIIIFMTDNGGNSENKQKGGVRFTHNAPLRNGKGSVYEGGVRVPAMFCWPGKITPGTRIANNIIAEDLFPTILEMAGVKDYDVVQEVDGQSLVKLLTDGSAEVAKAMKDGRINSLADANRFVLGEEISGFDPDRDIVIHYPHKWKPYDLVDIDYLTSIRKGEWKLVYRLAAQEVELYNTFDDISETKNLAETHPEKTAELAKALGDRLRQWNSPMPFIKETGEKVPMPDEI